MMGNGSSKVLVCGALMLLGGFASGCREDRIQSYRVVPVEPRTASQRTPPMMPAANPTGQRGPSRMVAAILQRPEAMWVFKIVGSPDQVAKTETAWRPFLEAVTFESESQLPRWTLPAGWEELPGNDFRHATLLMSGVDPPLELAISKLPPGQDLLMNVNRWRGQLELEPLSQDRLDAELGKISAGPETFLLFDATGVSASSTPMGGPQGVPPSSTAGGSTSLPTAGAAAAALPFEFSPPDQWESGPTTQFTLRRFVRTEGTRTVQLAITRLPSTGQSWNDNVGVWCGELGLPTLPPEKITEQTQARIIDGRPAQSILLKSDAEGKASQIVHWTTDVESWYIKLTGDASLVDESQATLDALVNSIRFKPQS